MVKFAMNSAEVSYHYYKVYSQSDTFFPKLKITIVKIDIKSFSVYIIFKFESHIVTREISINIINCNSKNPWLLCKKYPLDYHLQKKTHC